MAFVIALTAWSPLPARAGSLRSREVFIDPQQPPPPQDGGLGDGEFAFTFDDGPDPNVTPKILAALRKHEVKAVFFEVGTNAEAHPDLTRAVLSDGHSLGSHSWDHTDLTTIPLRDAEENIRRGHSAVERAAGSGFHTAFFRFPYFSWNDELLAVVRQFGLVPFHASVVTEDWLTPDPDELLRKAIGMLERERHGIILIHDVQPQSGAMLDAFLDEMEKHAYRTVVFREKNRASHPRSPVR